MVRARGSGRRRLADRMETQHAAAAAAAETVIIQSENRIVFTAKWQVVMISSEAIVPAGPCLDPPPLLPAPPTHHPLGKRWMSTRRGRLPLQLCLTAPQCAGRAQEEKLDSCHYLCRSGAKHTHTHLEQPSFLVEQRNSASVIALPKNACLT